VDSLHWNRTHPLRSSCDPYWYCGLSPICVESYLAGHVFGIQRVTSTRSTRLSSASCAKQSSEATKKQPSYRTTDSAQGQLLIVSLEPRHGTLPGRPGRHITENVGYCPRHRRQELLLTKWPYTTRQNMQLTQLLAAGIEDGHWRVRSQKRLTGAVAENTPPRLWRQAQDKDASCIEDQPGGMCVDAQVTDRCVQSHV
jgi:hypothetical protein